MACKLEETIFSVKTRIKTKSCNAVQIHFRRKFNFNTYPGKPQIFLRWCRNFQASGTVSKRSKKSDNLFSVRKLSVRSADNVKVRILCNDERYAHYFVFKWTFSGSGPQKLWTLPHCLQILHSISLLISCYVCLQFHRFESYTIP